MASAKKGGPHLFRDIADSLHVKKNTAGTSNELSLSVLDGLKSQADDKLGEGEQKVRLGDLSIFTVSSKRDKMPPFTPSSTAPAASKGASKAVPAKRSSVPEGSESGRKRAASSSSAARTAKTSRRAATTSAKARKLRERALADPDAEIKRRKKVRKIRRACVGACIAVASVSAIAVGALYVANEYQERMQNLSLLNQAFDEITKADSVVLGMDDIVTKEVSESSAEEIADVCEGIDDAELHLKAATAFAGEAEASMDSSSSKDAAGQVVASADARREMMGYAEALMQADLEALEAVGVAEEAWSLVEQADGLMKEAAVLVVDTTKENTEASQAKSAEAIVVLEQASAKVDEAVQLYPSADFSLLKQLIEKRIEQNEYAIKSDEAIYIQDKATAESFNDKYNQADLEAVALAEQLPERPAQPIIDAFQVNVKDTRDLYFAARKRAAESDAFIRDYLGEPGV